MKKAVDKYSPGTWDDPNFSEYAAQAWTGGRLIEAAVKKSGVAANADVSAADIKKALDSMKDETLDGWSPALTFTAGQPHSVDCWYTGRVQNGKPKLVDNGKLTCKAPHRIGTGTTLVQGPDALVGSLHGNRRCPNRESRGLAP